MDGVLVDNRDIHIEAFVIFGKRYGVEIDKDKLLSVFGMSNDEIIPVLLPKEILEKEDLQALGEEKEAIYREIFEDTIAPAPGLVKFIKEVRAHGIECAVGSSGSKENVDFVLSKCGINDYFKAAINGDMVKRAKPDPAIFLMAAKNLDINPANCLVIEDALAGIEAAGRAGMKVIGMASTHSKEYLSKAKTDLIVDNFEDLNYDIVSKL